MLEPRKGATLDEQVAEVQRECAMRESVYAKWVIHGRITAEESATRIRRMRAALGTLHRLRDAERKAQPTLALEAPADA